jgi:hypothetical protein
LPNPGQALLTISDSGLVGIIEVVNKKLLSLNASIQLKIREGGSITWSQSLKQYVAVGGNACIAKSSNSIFWEYVENPSLMGLSKVIWNKTLSHYVAIGKRGTLLVSRDGENWQIAESKTEVNLKDILWCPLKLHYIVIGEFGYIALSCNGIDWQVQASVVNSSLKGIATNTPWNTKKAQYVVITDCDEVLVSNDGKNWSVSLTKAQSHARGLKNLAVVYYDHKYSTKFFAIISAATNAYGSLYRVYQYDYGNSFSAWIFGTVIYLQDYWKSKISDFKKMMWCDSMASFVAVAKKPPVLIPIPYYPYIFKKLEILENASEFFQEGFSDMTSGLIPKLQDSKNTLYYATLKHS